MAEKNSGNERPLIQGEVPGALVEAFGQAVDDSGLVKKKAVATAAWAFIQADAETRAKWWLEASQKFYGASVAEPADPQADEPSGQGTPPPRQPRAPRRGSKANRSTGA